MPQPERGARSLVRRGPVRSHSLDSAALRGPAHLPRHAQWRREIAPMVSSRAPLISSVTGAKGSDATGGWCSARDFA